MSNTAANLRHKIDSASDLKGVVRTMKALAASSISQYEKSVSSLSDYYRTVELGLSATIQAVDVNLAAVGALSNTDKQDDNIVSVIVFGSDQGLVGQFNEDIADFAIKALADLGAQSQTTQLQVWAVGERVYSRLADAGLSMEKSFPVPTSINEITALVGQIQIDSETHLANASAARVYVFYNQMQSGGQYQPISQRLLPLDQKWQRELAQIPWPTKRLPEILGCNDMTLRALIREYIFISLYRACAESLASENASRLAAMQRAEKNIAELLDNLGKEFHELRQSAIDAELSDVLAGYELLNLNAD
ncbi:MAG TPA: F0F1 ATP synthase subunit gamma [Pseudoalteromonas prydzensis]|uniref:F0F1 ATP synthase subunit gamma n=1 Tax=Pseudoalteromonas prydzensis TaxID=182141 RepID=A0A7V1CV78_9GAMM|nr:F0F1 ATP synthase subunit gamma [Pseudoalteromonas prydzensis]HEA14928.1 F0F1 ATP synthase subunit gamma [Pseudoalteromonas prydzensis]